MAFPDRQSMIWPEFLATGVFWQAVPDRCAAIVPAAEAMTNRLPRRL
jgi:hypothetical protein